MLKRLIPCVIIAVSIVLMCVLGHYVAKKECDKTKTQLKKCEDALKKEDYKSAEKIAYKIKSDWENREEILAIFVNHTFLDEISKDLSELPYYTNSQNRDYGYARIENIKKLLHHILEHQSIVRENFY